MNEYDQVEHIPLVGNEEENADDEWSEAGQDEESVPPPVPPLPPFLEESNQDKEQEQELEPAYDSVSVQVEDSVIPLNDPVDHDKDTHGKMAVVFLSLLCIGALSVVISMPIWISQSILISLMKMTIHGWNSQCGITYISMLIPLYYTLMGIFMCTGIFSLLLLMYMWTTTKFGKLRGATKWQVYGVILFLSLYFIASVAVPAVISYKYIPDQTLKNETLNYIFLNFESGNDSSLKLDWNYRAEHCLTGDLYVDSLKDRPVFI